MWNELHYMGKIFKPGENKLCFISFPTKVALPLVQLSISHKTGEEQVLQLPFQADGPSFPAMAPSGARTLGLLASWLLSFQFLWEGLCWARRYIGLARKFI